MSLIMSHAPALNQLITAATASSSFSTEPRYLPPPIPVSTSSPLPESAATLVSLQRRRSSSSSAGSVSKKSRKNQGFGIRKPLYTHYESIFIIKCYKLLHDAYPDMVLVELFKKVEELFNLEAKKRSFKTRSADQLYQKYKRIQHGLNSGEKEFLGLFKRHPYNPKEWVPITEGNAVMDSMDIDISQVKHEVVESDSSSEKDEELLQLAGFSQSNDVEYLKKQLQAKDEEIAWLRKLLNEDISYIRNKMK